MVTPQVSAVDEQIRIIGWILLVASLVVYWVMKQVGRKWYGDSPLAGVFSLIIIPIILAGIGVLFVAGGREALKGIVAALAVVVFL